MHRNNGHRSFIFPEIDPRRKAIVIKRKKKEKPQISRTVLLLSRSLTKRIPCHGCMCNAKALKPLGPIRDPFTLDKQKVAIAG